MPSPHPSPPALTQRSPIAFPPAVSLLRRGDQEMEAEIDGARHKIRAAEAERDVLLSQISRLKAMLQRSQGEFAAIVSAVNDISHER